MAEKTLAQPAKSEQVIQWPKLEFMRINELAKRWQCDTSKIFDLIIAGNLLAHPREWMPLVTYIKQEYYGEEKRDMHAVTGDWFVPTTEIDRFEEEHRSGAHAGGIQEPRPCAKSTEPPTKSTPDWQARAQALSIEIRAEHHALTKIK